MSSLSLSAILRLVVIAGLLWPSLGAFGGRAAVAVAGSRTDLLASALAGEQRLDDPEIQAELIRLAPVLSRLERQKLTDLYYRQIIAGYTDLEAFARIVELAAGLNQGHTDAFMQDISRLTLDATGNWQALIAGPWGRLKQRLHARLAWLPGYPALGRFGCTGFAAGDGSNQVQHVWYSVALSYRYGAGFAELAACYHELNLPGPLGRLPGTGQGAGSDLDLALSRQGIALGQALAAGTLEPGQVGAWLREHLAPPPVAGV